MIAHTLSVSRTARYFTLGDEARPVREVWIGLHGHAQLAARFLRWLAPLDDGATLVVAPEALSRFYLETRTDGHHGPAIGATWLTREHREADLSDHLRYLDQLVEHLRRPLPASVSIGILGFSQGSALAARWLASGRSPADRAVLWGTPLPADVTPEALAAGLGHAPLVLVGGTDDPLVPPGTLESTAAALVARGARAEVRRFAGGHIMTGEVLLAAARRGTGA